jgi:uncharacterized membrane protein
MTASPILTTHIAAGGIALLFGAAALVFRKGSRRHQLTGKAFVVSMLVMATSGAYLAFSLQVMLSIIGGLLTFYLVATAWATVARSAGPPGLVEAGALLGALFIGGVSLLSGFEAANSETGLKDGFPPGQYFMFGTIALLAAAGDGRLIVRGGLTGAQRIARHLWRMCAALAIAASAFFLGQAQLFPPAVCESQILTAPVLLTLLAMLYWLYRVRWSRRARETALKSDHAPQRRVPAPPLAGRDESMRDPLVCYRERTGKMKRICIVGASGKLGQYMVQHALDRGYQVVGVCRERSVHKLERFKGRITIVPGATNDRKVIKRAVEGCDGVLTVLVPWGVHGYSSGTAQAVLDYARPDARLIFSCGWHITRDGQDVYSPTFKAVVKVAAWVARLVRVVDLDDQVEGCRRVFASNTRWTVVRGSDLEEGESQGLPVWSRHVGDAVLASNITRRVDFALFMVAALENDELIHEAPAIVGCRTPSALAATAES